MKLRKNVRLTAYLQRHWLSALVLALAAILFIGLYSYAHSGPDEAPVQKGAYAEYEAGEVMEILSDSCEPDPAAAEEAAALSAETQLDVLLLWGQGTPAELRATPYETTKTGARLYRVTGTLAQELLDHYAAALYAADSDFSDLPEQEEACVLVME